MRNAIALLLGVTCVMLASGQGRLSTRYNIDYDSNRFPQAEPKEALGSLIRAAQDKRVDYLLAHLTEPDYVDQQVTQVFGGKFEEMVKAVKNKLANDPDAIKQLQRFLKEGEWDVGETTASAKLKDLKQQVFFRKV